MATVVTTTVDITELLQVPPGWELVDRQSAANNPAYTDPLSVSPDTRQLTEAVEFLTLRPFGEVIGKVPSLNSTLAQEVRINGSAIYGSALLHRVDSNVTIPQQVCIGTFCVPVPGGGTTLLQIDRYRLIAVHGQWQGFLAWALRGLLIIIAAWLVQHFQTLPQALRDILKPFQDFFVAPITAAVTPFYVYLAVGGVAFLAYLAAVRSQGTPLPPPVPPSFPSQPPLNVSVSAQPFPLPGVAAAPVRAAGRRRR